jgi:hypothetical protein
VFLLLYQPITRGLPTPDNLDGSDMIAAEMQED